MGGPTAGSRGPGPALGWAGPAGTQESHANPNLAAPGGLSVTATTLPDHHPWQAGKPQGPNPAPLPPPSPPFFVATVGTPCAAASMTVSPKGSCNAMLTNTPRVNLHGGPGGVAGRTWGTALLAAAWIAEQHHHCQLLRHCQPPATHALRARRAVAPKGWWAGLAAAYPSPIQLVSHTAGVAPQLPTLPPQPQTPLQGAHFQPPPPSPHGELVDV